MQTSKQTNNKTQETKQNKQYKTIKQIKHKNMYNNNK